MHRLGYAHSDIKLENICAFVKSNGKLSFTLIDFGVSCKLRKNGDKNTHKRFRGNLQTASPYHIAVKRPNAVDDLISLLNSAFLFVKGSLPWFDDVLNSSKESEAKEFKERFALFRLKHRKKHAEEL